MKGITVAISILKGGAGKTTTCCEMARILNSFGNKVLVVDTDQQCNASDRLLTNYQKYSKEFFTLEDYLVGSCSFEDTIINNSDLDAEDRELSLKNCDLVLSSQGLMNADGALLDADSKLLIRNGINSIRDKYDYILLDSQPSIGIIPYSVMIAADYLLIPIDADASAFQNIGTLNEQIVQIKGTLNPDIQIAGLLMTRYNNRSNFNKKMWDMATMASNFMNTKLFNSFIRESVVVKEARAGKTFLLDYAPKLNPTIDYINFTKEFVDTVDKLEQKRRNK